jgi:ribosomal protein S18 acetylase RimI-like enzyme
MTTRPATPDDADLVYRIKYEAYAEISIRSRGSWDEGFQRGYTLQNLPYTQIILVETIPVGWIACQEKESRLDILDVHILPAHQRKGFGSKAIVAILCRADALEKEVELGVLKNNPSQKLYERLGFRATGETTTHTLMTRRPDKSPRTAR